MGNLLAPAVNKYRVCVPTAILMGDPLPEECECMNFTGGCDGADALGASQSIAHGHGVAHLCGTARLPATTLHDTARLTTTITLTSVQ